MTRFCIDLDKLKINVPTGYADGKPVGYYFKDIGTILEEKNPYELVVLEDWITKHILRFIAWDLKTLDKMSVQRAFAMFSMLGIKPTDCIYEGQLEQMDDSGE